MEQQQQAPRTPSRRTITMSLPNHPQRGKKKAPVDDSSLDSKPAPVQAMPRASTFNTLDSLDSPSPCEPNSPQQLSKSSKPSFSLRGLSTSFPRASPTLPHFRAEKFQVEGSLTRKKMESNPSLGQALASVVLVQDPVFSPLLQRTLDEWKTMVIALDGRNFFVYASEEDYRRHLPSRTTAIADIQHVESTCFSTPDQPEMNRYYMTIGISVQLTQIHHHVQRMRGKKKRRFSQVGQAIQEKVKQGKVLEVHISLYSEEERDSWCSALQHLHVPYVDPDFLTHDRLDGRCESNSTDDDSSDQEEEAEAAGSGSGSEVGSLEESAQELYSLSSMSRSFDYPDSPSCALKMSAGEHAHNAYAVD